jgi:hypothetical protein
MPANLWTLCARMFCSIFSAYINPNPKQRSLKLFARQHVPFENGEAIKWLSGFTGMGNPQDAVAENEDRGRNPVVLGMINDLDILHNPTAFNIQAQDQRQALNSPALLAVVIQYNQTLPYSPETPDDARFTLLALMRLLKLNSQANRNVAYGNLARRFLLNINCQTATDLILGGILLTPVTPNDHTAYVWAQNHQQLKSFFDETVDEVSQPGYMPPGLNIRTVRENLRAIIALSGDADLIAFYDQRYPPLAPTATAQALEQIVHPGIPAAQPDIMGDPFEDPFSLDMIDQVAVGQFPMVPVENYDDQELLKQFDTDEHEFKDFPMDS